MNYHLFSDTSLRVGILVLTRSHSLLDDVGQGAWHRSGGRAMEDALPVEEEYSLIRLLVTPGGNASEIAQILKNWCDAPNRSYRCHVVFIVGGDGRGSHDGAPEAVRSVAERELPLVIERVGEACLAHSSDAAETRRRLRDSGAAAGVRGQTLIINLPSCFDAPADTIRALKPLLAGELRALKIAPRSTDSAA